LLILLLVISYYALVRTEKSQDVIKYKTLLKTQSIDESEHPDYEKADFINKIFKKLWPFMKSSIKEFILNKIEPLLNEHVQINQKLSFDEILLSDSVN
jgi:hypothetical protein